MDLDSSQRAERAAAEIGTWWNANFFEPFSRLKNLVGPVFKDSLPPAQFLRAPAFARQLWSCCDDDDVRSLVAASPEGSSEFNFFVSILSYERLIRHVTKPPTGELVFHKPFAILASVALGWMEEVEHLTPGRITPIK